MDYILYKGNCYSKLKVHFSPKLNGADFFKILELVEFPIKESENVLLKYAITEFVTNSTRALNEKNIEKEIIVDFQVAGNFIKIVVIDFAGGFDLSKLPIKINEDLSKVDILSKEFQDYRERHEFSRFGIGLISSRLALDAFHLVFIDEEGNEAQWQGEGSVSGTRIVAAKRINNSPRTWGEGAYVRRNQRHSIFTKVVINNSREAYLIDISSQGIRLLLIAKESLAQGEIISVKIDNVSGFDTAVTFSVVVRWIIKEGAFWQIGSEFVKDSSFPLERISGLVEKVENNPYILPGLVVIEGT
jgi:hypothetical protein